MFLKKIHRIFLDYWNIDRSFAYILFNKIIIETIIFLHVFKILNFLHWSTLLSSHSHIDISERDIFLARYHGDR